MRPQWLVVSFVDHIRFGRAVRDVPILAEGLGAGA
jgi:hypothetical protein